MPASPTERTAVVWFKRDLRMADHAPLTGASMQARVVPLYVVEPEYWAQSDASRRQYQFVLESLAELAPALAALGAPLTVRTGNVVDVLTQLKSITGFTELWSHEETGNAWTFARDQAVAQWCRGNKIAWHERRQDGVVRRLTDRDGWARRWDGLMAQPQLEPPDVVLGVPGLAIEAPPSAEVLGLSDDGCTAPQRGGRAAALATLESFLTERGMDYRRAMSSPLSGATACSRLSPHLAWGTVSLREVTQATWRRQRALKVEPNPNAVAWRQALISFGGRLHWHCHFMQKLEREPRLEHRELHPATRGLRGPAGDLALMAAWQRGETGFPFVDACMRSLIATGWLNFRMRAMLVSFASYNLWLPWQQTGLHLARMFTDYEPGIHWPQMQMQSGATGINTIRVYNPIKQGHDQDPAGQFVRRWVPELAEVPDAFVQEPWTWGGAASLLGRAYPQRVVNLSESTAAAKDRIFAARHAPGFGSAADAIQQRHGSRRSGIAMTGARGRAKRPASPDTRQLMFDLGQTRGATD